LDENFGYNRNEATLNQPGNWVVVELEDGSVAGYFHLQKGQNKVNVSTGEEDKISTGTPLGVTGNSGSSTEPHLHFGYIVIHETGRGVNAPVAFSDLKTTDDIPVSGVPGFGRYKS